MLEYHGLHIAAIFFNVTLQLLVAPRAPIVSLRCVYRIPNSMYSKVQLMGDSIMMLVRFGDLSQSDCSKWVMWQVKDPQPRPGWDGCLTWEKMVYEKSIFFFLVNKCGYGLKKKCFDFMVWIYFFYFPVWQNYMDNFSVVWILLNINWYKLPHSCK